MTAVSRRNAHRSVPLQVPLVPNTLEMSQTGQIVSSIARGRANVAPCPMVRLKRNSVSGRQAMVAMSVARYHQTVGNNQLTNSVQTRGHNGLRRRTPYSEYMVPD